MGEDLEGIQERGEYDQNRTHVFLKELINRMPGGGASYL